ncbi:hypothetical protein NDU88_005883 [Pleurodeles waltl]|uniref:Uncharacterized protein n=1 Tax=Pleurodeles waltl TaxID=8319 RepID=A0AAV7RKF6_PLEWA|nr:hypothetical protein NDU88_005883 [Pleurodeles waltl]
MSSAGRMHRRYMGPGSHLIKGCSSPKSSCLAQWQLTRASRCGPRSRRSQAPALQPPQVQITAPQGTSGAVPSWATAAPLLRVTRQQGSRAAAQPEPLQAAPAYYRRRHRPPGYALPFGGSKGVLSPTGRPMRSVGHPTSPHLGPQSYVLGLGGGARTKHVCSRHHVGHDPKNVI